jgi:two-component system, NarL family, nitrate/nitrite response regulator NarL
MLASVNERSKVLSPRERQIALLIGRGLSNKDVARELGLSPGTVKIHVHNIFVKLREKSRHRIIVRYGT